MEEVRTFIGAGMVVIGFTVGWIAIIKIFIDAVNSNKHRRLKFALRQLGWEEYEDDLWRHRRSGVITSFQDAIMRELKISFQFKQMFPEKYLKQP